jgi:phospholipid/cholesterol/gamma-HCH transport system substrate-binding protein
MDLTYKQEVGVGAVVLLGLVIFMAGMFWLSGRSLSSSGVTAHVVFTNVSGLKEGDAVLISGVSKGRVGKVTLERVGRVTVNLELNDARVRPHMDASAVIASKDFFGAKFIDYSPGTPEKDLLGADRFIVGTNPPALTDLATGVATRANELIGNATGLVNDQLAVDIHNTLVATQRGMNVLTELGSGPMIKQTTQTLLAAERVMSHLDTVLGAGPVKRLDSLSTNLTQLTEHLSQATRSLNTLLAKVDSGQGTLGRMATDTTLYHDLHKTLTALSELLTDLKERPGRYLTVKVF